MRVSPGESRVGFLASRTRGSICTVPVYGRRRTWARLGRSGAHGERTSVNSQASTRSVALFAAVSIRRGPEVPRAVYASGRASWQATFAGRGGPVDALGHRSTSTG